MRSIRKFLVAFLWCGVLVPRPLMSNGIFPDAHESPPPGSPHRPFKLSQEYPTRLCTYQAFPWSEINFKTHPKEYMWAVLEYAYEGNVDHDWRVEDNPVRRWYHVPWLHWGDNGREYIHGMTRERSSRKCELSQAQQEKRQNWAVSVYNDVGGYTIGKVWADSSAPNPMAADFPVGTVAIKLLFTSASPQEVSFLKGSKEWWANINVNIDNPSFGRSPQVVRLLQVDLAVRDEQAHAAGWVFATFQYDADAPGTDPWRKLTPVALAWGNDPDVVPGGKLSESWVNHKAPIVQYRSKLEPSTLGWGGRANGPVDNPKSSCLSCHSTAQYPFFRDFVPPSASNAEKRAWFRNLERLEAFSGSDARSLDYSLQLAMGIQNFYQWVEVIQGRDLRRATSSPPRDEGLCTAVSESATTRGDARYEGAEARLIKLYRVSRDEAESELLKLLPSHSVSPP